MAGYTYLAHAQGPGVGADQFVGDRGLGTKNPIYQALNRAMGPGAVGSLATPYVVRCHPNVTCAHLGASLWLQLPRRDRFSSPRGVFALRVDVFVLAVRNVSLSLSRSLALPLSFLIECLRPFSPACHRRGRRHRRSCATLTVTRWSISFTYPLHSFKRTCVRVQLVPQERTSMRIDEQITNESPKHQSMLSSKRACCNA